MDEADLVQKLDEAIHGLETRHPHLLRRVWCWLAHGRHHVLTDMWKYRSSWRCDKCRREWVEEEQT